MTLPQTDNFDSTSYRIRGEVGDLSRSNYAAIPLHFLNLRGYRHQYELVVRSSLKAVHIMRVRRCGQTKFKLRFGVAL